MSDDQSTPTEADAADLEAALSSPELSAALGAGDSPPPPAADPAPSSRVSEASADDNGELPPWLATVKPEEPAPAATATETPPAAGGSLLERVAAEHGLDLRGKYANDDEALKGLASAFRRLSQRDDDANLARSIRDNPVAAYQWLERQLAEQGALPSRAPAAPPAAQRAAEPEVEYDPNWLHMLEQDPDTGQIRSKPGYDPEIPQKYARYQQLLAKRLPELVKFDARKEIEDLRRENRLAWQQLQAHQQQQYAAAQQAAVQQQQAQQAQQWTFQRPWLFEGGVMENGLSQHGRTFYDAFSRNRQDPRFAVVDDYTLADLTVDQLAARAGRESQTARAPVASRGVAKPTAGGSPHWADEMSLEEMLSRVIEENGISVGV